MVVFPSSRRGITEAALGVIDAPVVVLVVVRRDEHVDLRDTRLLHDIADALAVPVLAAVDGRRCTRLRSTVLSLVCRMRRP